jgi:hypothetical protein
MKTTILSIISLLIALSGSAQITITVDDLMDVGDSVNLAAVDSIPAGFSPGPAGANQHWDFSDLIMDTVYTLNFIDPATTPYGASFPTSNIATEGLVESFGAEGYAYATRNMSLFQIDGFAGSYDIIEDLVVPFNPPEVMFDFPVNYLDSLNQTSVMDVRVDSPEPGADSLRIKVVTSVDSHVDAWGELTTPTWVGDVLRFRDERRTIDSAWVKILFFWIFLETNTTEVVTYKYMANDVGYPVMQFNSNPDGTEYSMVNYVYYAGVGSEELIAPQEISFRVYPNPAQDVIHFWVQDLDAEAEVSIFNLQGQQLYAIPIGSNQQQLDIDVSAYVPGIYQMVLKTNAGQVSARKFIVW